MSEQRLYRNVQVNVRYTENEKNYIEQKAKYCNLSISEYCRKASISAVVIKVDTEPLFKILGELNRIGNNVNQIAKVIHEQGDYITEDNFSELENQFNAMKSIIIEETYNATCKYAARLNEIEERNANVKSEYDFSFDEYSEIFNEIDPNEIADDFEDYDEGAFT